MIYKKIINGPDIFGNEQYHVIIDECVRNNVKLGNYLKRMGYSVLVINKKPLKGVPDELLSYIALLNESVLFTSDKKFYQKLNQFNDSFGLITYLPVFVKKQSWDYLAKTIDRLLVSKIVMNNQSYFLDFLNNATESDLSLIVKKIEVINSRPFESLDDYLIKRLILRGVYEFRNPGEVRLLNGFNIFFKQPAR